MICSPLFQEWRHWSQPAYQTYLPALWLCCDLSCGCGSRGTASPCSCLQENSTVTIDFNRHTEHQIVHFFSTFYILEVWKQIKCNTYNYMQAVNIRHTFTVLLFSTNSTNFFIKQLSRSQNCLEGTFKGHLIQLPCNEQGHLQLCQCSETHPAWPQASPQMMGHSTTRGSLWLTILTITASLNLPSFSPKPFPLVLSQLMLL